MATTYKIAVVGDWDSVMGFQALGLATYPVSDFHQAETTIAQLAKEDCGIIYLTETLAAQLGEVLNKYKDALRPAIILIPGKEGSLGIGRENIQRAIERAVGTDIT
ncbi:V-type ATP synthase subunit F [Bengtsoniella intestinalis]|uniref:V-type ATP synthase subunit F n=1 Tax=Bengtsoniella intestinalis TaxID=3073143 RepID=UPI00391F9718